MIGKWDVSIPYSKSHANLGNAGLQRGGNCFDPESAAHRHVDLIDRVIGASCVN